MSDDKEPGWAKISIRQSPDDLVQYGPSIALQVSDLRGTTKIKVLAQIDTGADVTCISLRLAQKLSLKSIHTATVNQIGMASAELSCFEVRLSHPFFSVDLIVAALATLDPPHDAVIGRDLLKGGGLAIDFSTGQTALHIKSAS